MAADQGESSAAIASRERLPPIPTALVHQESKFPYSSHDNRHTTEQFGEHLGQKLGRRHTSKNSQHHTSNIISWNTVVPKTRSLYQHSFGNNSSISHKSESCPDKCFHRYSHNYNIEKKRPMHTTPSQRQEITPLSILAITQSSGHREPWKYSYKLHKI